MQNLRVNNFDILRFFAAVQVLLVHGASRFEVEGFSFLGVFPGVPIFFVISGYLISASWENNNNLKQYLLNRFFRIYPALWVCFLLSITLLFCFYDMEFSIEEFLFWVVSQVSFAQFYNPEFLRGFGVGVLNGSLWTIAIELQFYLSIPVFYLVMDRLSWNKFILLASVIIFSIINMLRYKYNYLWDEGNISFKLFCMTLFPYFHMFLFGIILQRYFIHLERYLVDRFHWWVGVYFLLLLICDVLEIRYRGNSINPILALALSITVISFSYSYVGKIKNIFLGRDFSYGIYIYHAVVINFLLHFSPFSSGVNLMLMCVVSLILGYLSWAFIEKPILSLKERSYLNDNDS